jgi:hypothetical protein
MRGGSFMQIIIQPSEELTTLASSCGIDGCGFDGCGINV